MCRFENILVGLDLARRQNLVSDRLSQPTEQAYKCAVELAKVFSSKLVFVYVLQVSAQTQRLIESEFLAEPSIIDKAKIRLNRLVQRASSEGVQAESRVYCGTSWQQLIRQVPRRNHDLVVIGARQLSLFQRFLQRSTGLRLLRSCPCPVWLARPQSPMDISSILVAVDQTEAGQWALDAGVSLAENYQSDLHVLHSFSSPASKMETDSLKPPSEISRMIANRLTSANLKGEVNIQKSLEPPCEAIQEYLGRKKIDLLALGNYSCDSKMDLAAQKLYPQLSCSLLALKSTPVDFIAPSDSVFEQKASPIF